MTDYQLINRVERYSKFLDNSSITSEVIADKGNCAENCEEAQKHGPKDLKQLTMNFINEHGPEVLESKSFLQAAPKLIKYILESCPNLRALDSQLLMFEASYRWGKAQMKMKDLEDSPANLRIEMEDILPFFNFSLMDPDAFLSYVVPKEVLTLEEKNDILKTMSISNEQRSSALEIFSKKMTTFPREIMQLQESLQENGKHVSFAHGIVDLNNLVSQIIELNMRHKIESITLVDVLLINENHPVVTAARLPNLKNLSLSILTSSTNLDMFNMICNQFTKYLFVSKRRVHRLSWPVLLLWQVNVNFFLCLNKIILLKVDHDDGSVVMNNFCKISLALKGMRLIKEIQTLAISFRAKKACEKSDLLTPLNSAFTLVLHDTCHLEKMELYRFVNGFTNISVLVLYNCGYEEIDLTELVGSIKLCWLSISHAILKGTKNSALFLQVRQLSLWNCHWDGKFDMIKLFPNVTHLSLYCYFVQRSMHKVLDEYLKYGKLEFVVVSGLGIPYDKLSENKEKKSICGFDGKFEDSSESVGNFCKISKNGKWQEICDTKVIEYLFQEFSFDSFREK